jgi:DNA-binding MarR family transcriptional regulator
VIRALPSRARDRNSTSARLRLDTFLPYRLSMLTAKMQAHLARHYQQVLALTLHEARIIAVLGYHRPVSSNAIVQHTTMDKATVSRAVARLMRRGLLTRRPDPDDRRLLVLDFTTRGARTYRDLAALAQRWEAWLTEAMPRTARSRLVRDLALLTQRLDAMPQPDFSPASRRDR